MFRFITRALTGRNPFRQSRHRVLWDAERIITLATALHVAWLAYIS